MPANAHALTALPHRRYIVTDGFDDPRDLVSWHPRIHNPGPMSFLRQRIAVAQPARLHFHTHFALPRFTYVALHQLKLTARTHYLHCTHLLCRHKSLRDRFAT